MQKAYMVFFLIHNIIIIITSFFVQKTRESSSPTFRILEVASG